MKNVPRGSEVEGLIREIQRYLTIVAALRHVGLARGETGEKPK